MTQPSMSRTKTSFRMMLASFAMLIAAVIAFIVHAVAVGAIFLVLMVACGITGFVMAVSASRRLTQEQRRLMSDEVPYQRRP